jgi:hypothetical protein
MRESNARIFEGLKSIERRKAFDEGRERTNTVCEGAWEQSTNVEHTTLGASISGV